MISFHATPTPVLFACRKRKFAQTLGKFLNFLQGYFFSLPSGVSRLVEEWSVRSSSLYSIVSLLECTHKHTYTKHYIVSDGVGGLEGDIFWSKLNKLATAATNSNDG